MKEKEQEDLKEVYEEVRQAIGNPEYYVPGGLGWTLLRLRKAIEAGDETTVIQMLGLKDE